MKTKILIDAGHWDELFDHYDTYPGKRFGDIKEGVINRLIAALLVQALDANGIDSRIINPGPARMSDRTKVDLVNRSCKHGPRALVCIHLNAGPKAEWSKHAGFVIFHAKNASHNSKILAGWTRIEMLRELRGAIDSRYDHEKQRNLILLSKTKCPAILVECGFMTHRKDAAALLKYETQVKIATALMLAIKETFKED
jgi:N-acetylmuramoyl-L-alanine amidase